MEQSHESLGMLGLGLLGTAFGERLLHSGRMVAGFDLEAARRDHFQSMGGRVEASAAAVARHANRLLLSLPDEAAVASVIDDLLPHLTPATIVLDTTTVGPDFSIAIARRLAAAGVTYLDATVAGSSQQARYGDIVMMIGGEVESVGRVEPLLQLLARQVFHVGPAGSGARMKLIVNLVLGLHRAALAEGLSLARRCGLEPQQTLAVLRSGAAYSAAMDSKGQKMLTEEFFPPQARLAQHLKDVRLIRELAATCGADLPLSDVHQRLLEQAVELGLGDADNSAVIKVFA
jgi:3-hydroxyisobutyrate dehydrogenase-like beta-hydroxyacid dehydrogenase